MAKQMTPEERDQFHESIAQAMLTVIDKRKDDNPDVNLDWITQSNKKVPEGFWGEVREILNNDGVTRPSGKRWENDNHLSVQYVLKSKKKADIYGRVARWLGIEIKKEKPSKKTRQKKQRTPEPKGSSVREKHPEEADLHDTVKQLADEVRYLRQEREVRPHRPDRDDTWDEPDFPHPGSVDTKRVSADINVVLWNLLETEKERQGDNRARALQIIMWRGLGRPSLFPKDHEEKGE